MCDFLYVVITADRWNSLGSQIWILKRNKSKNIELESEFIS